MYRCKKYVQRIKNVIIFNRSYKIVYRINNKKNSLFDLLPLMEIGQMIPSAPYPDLGSDFSRSAGRSGLLPSRNIGKTQKVPTQINMIYFTTFQFVCKYIQI